MKDTNHANHDIQTITLCLFVAALAILAAIAFASPHF